jgi:Sulfotransferase domain
MNVPTPSAMLPTFFIPGAAKAGTSSLHEMLAQHPRIHMSRPKELHVFSHPDRAPQAATIYERIFPGPGDGQHRGESSTSYLVSRTAIDEIARRIPDARFICLLRDPVARTISHYNWMRAQGLEWRPFRRAVMADRGRTFDVRRHYAGNYRHYLQCSKYGSQVEHVLRRFDASSVLVVTTERFKENPTAVVHECFRFLGIDQLESVTPVWENRTPTRRWHPLPALLWSIACRIPRVRGTSVGNAIRQVLDRLPGQSDSVEGERREGEDTQWLRDELAEDRALLQRALGRDFPEWTA